MTEPLLDLQPMKLHDESQGVFEGDARKYVPSHQQLRAAALALP